MADQPAFIEVHRLFFDYTSSQPRFLLRAGAKKTFPVLHDVSFQLPQGSHVTLFGTESAGKSTLLRLLAGELTPSKGDVLINGRQPSQTKHAFSGYVSSEPESQNSEACYNSLLALAKTQQISDPAARVNSVADLLKLSRFLHRPAGTLSRIERLRLNLARAAICDSPLLLFDDVTDHFSAKYLNYLLKTIFSGRTVIVATRSARAADKLNLPVLLLHNGTLIHQGTIDEIALSTNCPRIIDIWIEGLRYDILRKLRQQVGVMEARLIPSDQFAGQRLRVKINSARYLPAMYDLVSQTNLVQVKEIPPSLIEIINRLASNTNKERV